MSREIAYAQYVDLYVIIGSNLKSQRYGMDSHTVHCNLLFWFQALYHNVCILSSTDGSGRPTRYSRNDISHVSPEVDRTMDRGTEEELLLSVGELQALPNGIQRC